MAVGILLLLVLVPLIFGVPILLGLLIYLLVRNKNPDQTGSSPAPSNDKTLIKILIAILIIPIALIFLVILLVFFLGMARHSVGITSSYSAIPVTEYLETSGQRETIEDWLNSCSTTPDADCYVLQYTPKPETGGDYQYLIYIPEAGEYRDMNTDLDKKLFSHWMFQVEIQCTESSGEQLLFFVTYNGTETPEEINVLYNSQELEEEITHTQQPLEDKMY